MSDKKLNPATLEGANRVRNSISLAAIEPENNHNTKLFQAPALRPYQTNLLTDIRSSFADGATSVLTVLPTGAGKTVTFTAFAKAAAGRGYKVAILAHRAEILDQIAVALERVGLPFGTIASGAPEIAEHQVQIASVPTLARRLDRWAGKFDFLIIDEAHHAVAGSWGRIIAANPKARILGVTATPERLDGRGLGDVFVELIEGPATPELIKAGYLAPFSVYAPSAGPDLSAVRIRCGDYVAEDLRETLGGIVIGSAVAEYQRLASGKRAICFCVDIEHSRAVSAAFNDAGIRAAHIDGETPAEERRRLIGALGSGALDVLSNCGLVSEGLDVPGTEAAILLRPTASLALYLQQVGRALRPAPGKDRALILDFAGNCTRHGLPDEERAWCLESKPRRSRASDKEAPKIRRCEACGRINSRNRLACVECGADLRTPRERLELQIQLRAAEEAREAAAIRAMNYSQRLRWAGDNELRLRLIAAACGYRRGWLHHVRTEIGATR